MNYCWVPSDNPPSLSQGDVDAIRFVYSGFLYAAGDTLFYAYGDKRCAFSRPGQRDMFRVLMAPPIGVDPGTAFQDQGLCRIPGGYFAWASAVYFTSGDGRYCAFPTPQALAAHRARRADHQLPNYTPTEDPSAFLTYIGACQP